jgi:hypothetical protein
MRESAVRQNFFRRRRIEVETRKLHLEEHRTNKLLANLLPPAIVPRLRGAERSLIADSFDEVTILWTDMKGFTSFSSQRVRRGGSGGGVKGGGSGACRSTPSVTQTRALHLPRPLSFSCSPQWKW